MKSTQEIEGQINFAKKKLAGTRLQGDKRLADKAELEGRINALEWGISRTRPEIEEAIVHYKQELTNNEEFIVYYLGPCPWVQELKGIIRALEWILRSNINERKNQKKHNDILNPDGTPKRGNPNNSLPVFIKECYIRPRR